MGLAKRECLGKVTKPSRALKPFLVVGVFLHLGGQVVGKVTKPSRALKPILAYLYSRWPSAGWEKSPSPRGH